MNETTTTPTVSLSLSYRNLRLAFLAGFALNILLTFVPSMKVKVGGLIGVGGEEKTLSALNAIRLISQAGQFGVALLFVLFFCITVAFLVLASFTQNDG